MNINDPIVRFVGAVIALGVMLLLITLIPFGVVIVAALIAIVYYLVKMNKRPK